MDERHAEHRPETYEPPAIVDYGERHGPALDLPHHPLHPSRPHPHFSS